jgi:hypothetical protein
MHEWPHADTLDSAAEANARAPGHFAARDRAATGQGDSVAGAGSRAIAARAFIQA